MNQELVRAVRDRRAILFVGAGVSMNLGLPSFSGLVEHLANELGYDSEIFSTHGDYLSLAEYYLLERRHIGGLRSWMDRTWHAAVDIGSSEIHKAIVDLDFPIIYTTNYDRWLELAHEHWGRQYTKVANVGDLARVSPDRTQIVKFHGDFDDDASIVLSETSYFERLDFETPLDLKLRADLLGRSVLFVGYSLGDINIRLMLYRLTKQWSGYETERPDSFVFLARPNPVQERILENRGVHAIVSESDDAGEGLKQFLIDLRREASGRP